MTQYHERFPVGSLVKIESRDVLEQFERTWKLHNKLRPEQLAYAGRVVRVVRVGYYHGGDVLYELEGVPGNWHEECLRPPE